MICTLLAGIIMLIYVASMLFKIKMIPPSISETYYLGGKSFFTLSLIASGFLLSAGLITLSNESPWTFLGFFAGGSLLFIGAAAQFKEELTKEVHYGGAAVLTLASQAWICIFATPWIMLLWLTSLLWIRTSQYIFWAEIVIIASLLLAMIFV